MIKYKIKKKYYVDWLQFTYKTGCGLIMFACWFYINILLSDFLSSFELNSVIQGLLERIIQFCWIGKNDYYHW